MEPYFKVKIGNGDEFNLADKVPGLSYLGLDDSSSSPQYTNAYQDSTGRDGSVFTGQTMAKRTFNERFLLSFRDWKDYQLAKHELYKIFGSRQLIRVRTDTNDAKVYFGYPTPFDITPTEAGSSFANFTIPFDVPDGYRYSLYRSDSPYTFKQHGWQFGMNLPKNIADVGYHFTSNKFKVYNASDITVDPYTQRHDLQIIVKFKGSSLQIANKTTGTSWKYNSASDGNHKIVWNGKELATYLDGQQVNMQTDFGYLTLAKEWNKIECTGADSVDITFSFPFIYLS